ncbi:hypothetical protein DEM27_03020 [Metarhizobium album]|uniref:Flagellin n=1 Tax=Metarhizobium album TaxID=2182425 RepID=A0A2U2DXY8_9HYPH|nr:flagellin [Rhizobium album]PWE58166.1 hypothetical protein DEM27_03020 [Rhizobium album]
MTSILTNGAAISALDTLRSINNHLEATQQRISSGLRVRTASDNAAYWSISTTMRSDNMALSTVADALGLGAAKIDTTYTGLESTVDILSEFRAKLVAAKEPGIDKSKIQKELNQFKEQLKSIAASSSFSGVNWLETNVPQNLRHLPSLPTDIVSSFIRSSDGSVRVGTTTIDVAEISLFNLGGGGSLQKSPGSLGTIGGFRTASLNAVGVGGTDIRATTGFPFALTSSDVISFDVAVDGLISQTVTIDKTLVDATLGIANGNIATHAAFATVLNQALVAAGVDSYVYADLTGSQLTFISKGNTGAPTSSVVVDNITRNPPGPTGFSSGYEQRATTGLPLVLSVGEQINLDISVDGLASQTLTIDDSLINSSLGVVNGTINDADDYVAVLTQALINAGAGSNIQVMKVFGSSIRFTSTESSGGSFSGVTLSNIVRTPSGASGLAGGGSIGSAAYVRANGYYAQAQYTFTTPFTVTSGSLISFDVKVGTGTQTTINIDRNLVDAALGTSDGLVNSAAAMATVLSQALTGQDVTVTSSGSQVIFDIDPAQGFSANFLISDVSDNVKYRGADFDIVDVDITDPVNDLDNYIDGVDAMLERVVNSAAALGAIKTRVDIQTDFAHTLMDTLDKGIGRLVDAEMGEASTRLKALQTQQQLGIQALQIANSNAENILQLFNQ